METSTKVLVVDPNSTVLQCAARALKALEVEVQAEGEWPEEAEALDLALLVLDCSRISEQDQARVAQWLDDDARPPILPLSPRPERIPEAIAHHPRCAQPLEKPFTPTELCLAALAAHPELNPALDRETFIFHEKLDPVTDAIELDMTLSDDEGLDFNDDFAGDDFVEVGLEELTSDVSDDGSPHPRAENPDTVDVGEAPSSVHSSAEHEEQSEPATDAE
ncbi:MAG: hypothetical protein AAFS10_04505, partial [Myxococcota bacterium]